MRRIVMLLREENVEKRTGQQAQAAKKDGRKAAMGNVNQEILPESGLLHCRRIEI
jgi:hypothetical protein